MTRSRGPRSSARISPGTTGGGRHTAGRTGPRPGVDRLSTIRAWIARLDRNVRTVSNAISGFSMRKTEIYVSPPPRPPRKVTKFLQSRGGKVVRKRRARCSHRRRPATGRPVQGRRDGDVDVDDPGPRDADNQP